MFQCMMLYVSYGLEGTFVYLDNNVIAIQDEEEHTCYLNALFTCLQANGLIVRPKKCQFGHSKLNFLAHCVNPFSICLPAFTLLTLFATSQVPPSPQYLQVPRSHQFLSLLSSSGCHSQSGQTVHHPANFLWRGWGACNFSTFIIHHNLHSSFILCNVHCSLMSFSPCHLLPHLYSLSLHLIFAVEYLNISACLSHSIAAVTALWIETVMHIKGSFVRYHKDHETDITRWHKMYVID